MASEVPVSDHSSQEEVEKEAKNKIEQEVDVSVPKETTAVATPCPGAASDPVVKETAQAVALLAEEKIEDKLMESPRAKELKKAEAAREKPAEQLLAEAVPALEKLEDKPIEAPSPADQLQKEAELLAEEKIEGIMTVEPVPVPIPLPEDKKIEDVPVGEAPADNGIQEVAKGTNSHAGEATIDDGKSHKKSEPDQPVEESKVELIEEKPQELATESKPEPVEELKLEPVEGKLQVLEKIIPGPVKENEQELPPKVVEVTEAKDVTVAEASCELEGASAPAVAPVAEAKLSEVVKQAEEEKQPPEAASVVKVEPKGPPQEVHEDVKLLKEGETSTVEGSDQAKSETPAIQAEPKAVTNKATETIGEGNEPKDTAKDKIEAETKELEAKPEEKSVVAEELVQCEQKSTEGVMSSAPPPNQPAEKPEVLSRGIEPVVVDNGNKEEETSADQTAKDVKIEEAAATVAKPEDEKRVGEPAKTDVKDSECNKDSEEAKTTEDQDKGSDVLTKPHKSSIVKMVKQSLEKAKKAILGKSNHGSKTSAHETKDQGNK